MGEYKNRLELERAFAELTGAFKARWQDRKMDGLLAEINDLSAAASKPDFWENPDAARETSVRKADLDRKAEPWVKLRDDLAEFLDLVELTFEEVGEPREALVSLEADFAQMGERFEALQMQSALSGEDDHRNAIVTINSGAGGTESQDWAQMLLRMYRRWVDDRHFRVDVLDYQDGEEAGIKSATLLVKGENAFGLLKCENGVHRLVRISPFDSNKRRHTSFASVHVMPELDDDVEVEIDEGDLRVDTYRSSGAGGQHVNKTDSAVRLTHLPTGVVVACQNERSQHKNKATAMKMLHARLYQLEKEKREEDLESRSGEKRDVAWGSQIRSYVFHPYKMVKDLRTDHETSDVEGVMDGNLDPFINAFLRGLSEPSTPRKKESVDVS